MGRSLALAGWVSSPSAYHLTAGPNERPQTCPAKELRRGAAREPPTARGLDRKGRRLLP
jgi:hypothetical protein